MTEEVLSKVRDLYDKVMEYPYKIIDIFNDYFGEDNVDLQDIMSFDVFCEQLKNTPIRYFFNKEEHKAIEEIERHNIDTNSKLYNNIVHLIDGKGFNKPLISDNNILEPFLPIIDNAIREYLKNQQCYILIHFPSVRITNEDDKYIDITHLYVKVPIYINGTMVSSFTMNRGEYSIEQLQCNYMHSHIMDIPKNDFSQFKTPCLGTGPIKNTIFTLTNNYDENIWKLFCVELDNYVKTESKVGTPYHCLESVIQNRQSYTIASKCKMVVQSCSFNNEHICSFGKEYIRNFITYLLQNYKLRFNYSNGSYGIAMSYKAFSVFISNIFIEWYNQQYNEKKVSHSYDDLCVCGIIKQGYIKNGVIAYYRDNDSTLNYKNYENKYVCTFKGQPVVLNIIYKSTTQNNVTNFLDKTIIDAIIKAILTVINYKYGRENTEGTPVVGLSNYYL